MPTAVKSKSTTDVKALFDRQTVSYTHLTLPTKA